MRCGQYSTVMANHSRDWWLHESEHILVVLLLAVVLFQAAQVAGDSEDGVTVDEQVMIVPASESFTVRSGQEVRFPWMVVNRGTEMVEVTSGVEVDWESSEEGDVPDTVTALLVNPAYLEMNAIQPGSHKVYEYRFNAPTDPGQYRMALVAEGDGSDVRESITMTVVPGQ